VGVPAPPIHSARQDIRAEDGGSPSGVHTPRRGNMGGMVYEIRPKTYHAQKEMSLRDVGELQTSHPEAQNKEDRWSWANKSIVSSRCILFISGPVLAFSIYPTTLTLSAFPQQTLDSHKRCETPQTVRIRSHTERNYESAVRSFFSRFLQRQFSLLW
jgi:hypothetical protein